VCVRVCVFVCALFVSIVCLFAFVRKREEMNCEAPAVSAGVDAKKQ
jgi:hypothetical protein